VLEKVEKKPSKEYPRPGSTRWNRGFNPPIRRFGRLDGTRGRVQLPGWKKAAQTPIGSHGHPEGCEESGKTFN